MQPTSSASKRVLVPPAPAGPIFPASVYVGESFTDVQRVLAGDKQGYVYARDGHPNADALAEACRSRHGADWAIVTPSGMASLAVALLSCARAGDHVIISSRLYGRSLKLLRDEAARLGIECSVADLCDLDAAGAALRDNSRLVVTETITNPTLRLSDIPRLGELIRGRGCRLLVDNTLAGPECCRPLAWGADLVVESLTKSMNGHSDVVLGLLCGAGEPPERLHIVHSTWGFTPGPFECWLAERGLKTYSLRAQKACATAKAIAQLLTRQPEITQVHYPGLPGHPDHALAKTMLRGGFGSIVAFSLKGGLAAAVAFHQNLPGIPFCPSFGELETTYSHPATTSHLGLSAEERTALGIEDGLIRLSVGIEPLEWIHEVLSAALAS